MSLAIFSVVPPTEPCALRSTQHLKVSTRDFSWGKGGRWVWLTTYHPCSAETSRKSGTLTYPEPLGPPRPVAGTLLPYYHKFTQVSMQCSRYSSQVVTKLEFCRLIFVKSSFIYRISWKFFQREPSFFMRTDRQTDRQTDMTKLIDAYPMW